jgi:uncharacterized protein (TIGR02421 family)
MSNLGTAAVNTEVELKPSLLEAVVERLRANQPVRRTLPIWGRLHVDRQVPFLCIYRRAPHRVDRWTDRLIVGEASYLKASGDRRFQKSLSQLVDAVVRTLGSEFGAFLLVEVWAAPEPEARKAGVVFPRKPEFRVLVRRTAAPTSTVEALRHGLRRIRIAKTGAKVEVVRTSSISPPGLPPILPAKRIKELSCHLIGLEVRPVFRDFQGQTLFPAVRRKLHRGIGLALKQTFFRFATDQTTHRPPHFHSLGRRAVVKAVWEVDHRLAKISGAIDLMMLITPVNTEQAWARFQRDGCRRAPTFLYRPIPVAPPELKRRLSETPIHRIEDPTLADVFEEKRTELDRKISMLRDRGTPDFLSTSLQLFGSPDDALLSLAGLVFETLSSKRHRPAGAGRLAVEEITDRARGEIQFYRESYPGFLARVRIRRDIPGVMVSRGSLLVGTTARANHLNVHAMLQHEIGTHLLCHYNGNAQPLRLLRSGLPRYEELQEGLAVLAEYLAGGLNRSRLRILAARVLAVRRLTQGAGFVDVFRELHDEHRFDRRTAFVTATRVFRGGGFTKDVVYLRGLVALLEYLRRGGALEILFVGRFAPEHVPIIEELLWRKVLRPAPLRPRYLDEPESLPRLRRIRSGITVPQMIEEANG